MTVYTPSDKVIGIVQETFPEKPKTFSERSAVLRWASRVYLDGTIDWNDLRYLEENVGQPSSRRIPSTPFW